MACPFFIPTEAHQRELWPHRYRLPLGDGFAGHCSAHAPDTSCDDETLRLRCNLGYAACAHLPVKRTCDAVRFLVQSESSITLRVQFACEFAHRPALSGELRYDQPSKSWLEPPEPQLLQLANAAIRAWMRTHVPHAEA